VARAGGALEDVPEVVESSVGMLGVHVRKIRYADAPFVEEDERIDRFV
jgi:hypothetical protein